MVFLHRPGLQAEDLGKGRVEQFGGGIESGRNAGTVWRAGGTGGFLTLPHS